MVDFLTHTETCIMEISWGKFWVFQGLTKGFVLEFGRVAVLGPQPLFPHSSCICFFSWFFTDGTMGFITNFHHHLGKYVWFTFSKHRVIKSKSCFPHSLAMPRYLGPSPHLRPRICARRSRDNVNSCAGRKKAGKKTLSEVFWTLNFGVKKSWCLGFKMVCFFA